MSRASAHAAVERLLFAYCERLDAGDFAGVGQLFAHGELCGSAGTTTVLHGATEVARHLAGRVVARGDGRPGTMHLTTNVVIDVREPEGTATAASAFCVLQAVPSGSIACIAAGRYRDSFLRRGTEWWFAKREVNRELNGDLSSHLMPD